MITRVHYNALERGRKMITERLANHVRLLARNRR